MPAFASCLNLLLSLFVFMMTPRGYARFLETDERLIDQEEKYNTETYNDKFSYRFPIGWYQLFDDADTAVRMHAGSLNISRFDYLEEIKFRAANSSAGFSYYQHRHEDVLEQRTSRVARMDGFFPSRFYVSMLADGGTLKEYGDMGWAVGVGDVKRPWVELLYWSPDFYYDTKKSDEGDKRTRHTWTLQVTVNTDLSERLAARLFVEYDHPLRWERESQGYTYEYNQRRANVGAKYILAEKQSLLFDVSLERKYERKDWYSTVFEKVMDRDVSLSELRWVHQKEQVDTLVGLGYLLRAVTYDHKRADPNDPSFVEPTPEKISPEMSRRDEFILTATRSEPLAGDRHFMQNGLFVNYVDLDDGKHVKVAESKYQWAWEYRYTEQARVLLNTTWDINQLTDDFPYKKRPFRPWGGGDIQFIAAF